MRNGRRVLNWVLLAALVAGLVLSARLLRVSVVVGGPAPLLGQWVYLSDLPWEEASTGWLAVANSDNPATDSSFSGWPLQINGTVFEKGLGTYPLSQITYRLGAQYLLFQAYIGVNDDSADAEARFLVLVDGILIYNSGPVRRGEGPRHVELFVYGANELRLVPQVGADAGPAYTDWAEARLLRSFLPGEEEAGRQMRRQVEAQQQARRAALERDRQRNAALSSEWVRIFDRASSAVRRQAVGQLDQERGLLLLVNDRVGAAFGYGGEKHGMLTLFRRDIGQTVLHEATPAVEDLGVGERLDLRLDTEPEDFMLRHIVDPVFGQGQELTVSLRATEERPWRVHLFLTVFDGQPYINLRLRVTSTVRQEVGSPRFRFLQGISPNLIVGEDLEYVTDFSRMRHSRVADDGLLYREAMGNGKPLYLWSSRENLGLLLSIVDEAAGVARFSIQRDQGQIRARLGVSAGKLGRDEYEITASSPTLYIEPTCACVAGEAFANYRRLMAVRYPARRLPDWVRYQWLSWYVYYMDFTERDLRRQIDYIADNLGDLGPWHIIVDAGWYVAEGREGADWRNVDTRKLPSGLRALVDYAHQRGVRVVLYFSAPYLDSRQRPGDWLGLRNIIEQHPEWLSRIGEDENRESYVYDFSHPGLRQYLREVMADFFVRYNVDGIKIDGLGNAEGALLSPGKLDGFGLVEKASAPTMQIYRFVYERATRHNPDAYIEAGWMTPLFANRYCHTFRYGDERAAFSSEYPFPGLMEHIDYAVLQKEMIAQRPNMGAIIDSPNDSQINRWWLGAALALGTQVSLSFDLTDMNQEALSAYRSLLTHYDPFKGETRVSNFLYPEVFVTTREGTSYLGILNRSVQAREFTVELAAYGLDAEQAYAAYDVEEQAFRPVQGALHTTVPGASFRLFLLRRSPGVLWTNSAFQIRREANSLTVAVRGPASLPGHMAIYAPNAGAVYLDGEPLTRTRRLAQRPGSFSYNRTLGVVRLQYDHDRPHEIRVEVQ